MTSYTAPVFIGYRGQGHKMRGGWRTHLEVSFIDKKKYISNKSLSKCVTYLGENAHSCSLCYKPSYTGDV